VAPKSRGFQDSTTPPATPESNYDKLFRGNKPRLGGPVPE
jgi:hypothetical protein